MTRSPQRCPECHHSFGLNWSWLHGSIGPKLYRCRKCENVTQSHRGEWPSKSRSERRRYIRHSAVFTILATAAATAAGVAMVLQLDGELPGEVWITSTAGVVALVTGLWQGSRVFVSLQRDGVGSIDPREVSFRSYETNMLWTIATPFVAAAAMVLLRDKL